MKDTRGLNTGGLDNKGGSGQNGFGVQGGADVQRRQGEYRVQVEEGECKGRMKLEQGNYKMRNNKIGRVQGKLEIS